MVFFYSKWKIVVSLIRHELFKSYLTSQLNLECLSESMPILGFRVDLIIIIIIWTGGPFMIHQTAYQVCLNNQIFISSDTYMYYKECNLK